MKMVDSLSNGNLDATRDQMRRRDQSSRAKEPPSRIGCSWLGSRARDSTHTRPPIPGAVPGGGLRFANCSDLKTDGAWGDDRAHVLPIAAEPCIAIAGNQD